MDEVQCCKYILEYFLVDIFVECGILILRNLGIIVGWMSE